MNLNIFYGFQFTIIIIIIIIIIKAYVVSSLAGGRLFKPILLI